MTLPAPHSAAPDGGAARAPASFLPCYPLSTELSGSSTTTSALTSPAGQRAAAPSRQADVGSPLSSFRPATVLEFLQFLQRGMPSQVPRALERKVIPLPPAVEAPADPRPSQQRLRRRPAVLGPGSSPRPSTAEPAKTPTQDEVGDVPEAAGPASRPWPPHAGGAKSWCRLSVAAEQIPPNLKMSFIFNLKLLFYYVS